MVIFHSYVNVYQRVRIVYQSQKNQSSWEIDYGLPKKRMTCIEMEHTKFIEFRQPRSGASLFICILCEIHGPEDSIQSCKCVISAGFGMCLCLSKCTVAKAGSGFLSHAQCKSSFLWFCLTTGYPILWFITIFSWPVFGVESSISKPVWRCAHNVGPIFMG